MKLSRKLPKKKAKPRSLTKVERRSDLEEGVVVDAEAREGSRVQIAEVTGKIKNRKAVL